MTQRSNSTLTARSRWWSRASAGVGSCVYTARILGKAASGKTYTLVVYGPAGETGSLRYEGKELTFTYPSNEPQRQSVVIDGILTYIVAMNTALADRTWITNQYVICGPAFVGDAGYSKGKFSLTIERPYGQPSCGKVIVYGSTVHHFAVHSDPTLDSAPAPQLGDWQVRLAPEAAADYDDAGWKQSAEPQQMGADGDTSAFAWYRATVNVKTASAAKIHFSGSADDLVVLVNGRRYDPKVPLAAGRNMIAVLASHRGRDKAFGYMGTLDTFARKGLFGPVQLTVGGEKMDVAPWKMRGGAGPIEGNWQPAATTPTRSVSEGLQARSASEGSGVTHSEVPDRRSLAGALGFNTPGFSVIGVPAFYRTTFTAKTVPGRILRATTKGLSRGTMWLNGHNLGRYPEKIKAPGMYLPECWLQDGANTLTVFDEDGAAIDLVRLEVETAASREVIEVSVPCDPSTPLVVPAEAKPADIAAANKGNLAFKRPASASSSEGGNTPEMANDGDPDTRWCAASGRLPQWWQVDLGGPHDLAGCEICWESDGRRYQYVVEGSGDGKTWSVLCDRRKTEERSQVQKLRFTAAGVRYVRITVTGTAASPSTWASICEVKVSGRDAVTQSVRKKCSARLLESRLEAVFRAFRLKPGLPPAHFFRTLSVQNGGCIQEV